MVSVIVVLVDFCDFCVLFAAQSSSLYTILTCLYFFGLPLLVVVAPVGCFYHYHGYIYFPQLIKYSLINLWFYYIFYIYSGGKMLLVTRFINLLMLFAN